jgi:hypothetical protein
MQFQAWLWNTDNTGIIKASQLGILYPSPTKTRSWKRDGQRRYQEHKECNRITCITTFSNWSTDASHYSCPPRPLSNAPVSTSRELRKTKSEHIITLTLRTTFTPPWALPRLFAAEFATQLLHFLVPKTIKQGVPTQPYNSWGDVSYILTTQTKWK